MHLNPLHSHRNPRPPLIGGTNECLKLNLRQLGSLPDVTGLPNRSNSHNSRPDNRKCRWIMRDVVGRVTHQEVLVTAQAKCVHWFYFSSLSSLTPVHSLLHASVLHWHCSYSVDVEPRRELQHSLTCTSHRYVVMWTSRTVIGPLRIFFQVQLLF